MSCLVPDLLDRSDMSKAELSTQLSQPQSFPRIYQVGVREQILFSLRSQGPRAVSPPVTAVEENRHTRDLEIDPGEK